MEILKTSDSDFAAKFSRIQNRGNVDINGVSKIVSEILREIKNDGFEAVLRHIAKFDKWNPKSLQDIKISQEAMKNAYDCLSSELKSALNLAYKRIYDYHTKQKQNSWLDFGENGEMLGVKITPIERAGLYIPGGKAAYPSSLLMNAIPAIVAGVSEIVVCTPTPENKPNDLLLAAMYVCGIKSAYKVGGASAIGLMAFGVDGVNKVDVISGPGNIFVACAKKLVFGEVNVDMIAGPSEIGILADECANSEYIAIDMLAQAEHDEMASSILITHSEDLANRVREKVEVELESLERVEIARKSIANKACIIITQSLSESVKIANKLAVEHLEILCENPFSLLPLIKNAGAIFLGEYAPEAIGDYIAGPNHTLPTGGSARFFSPLSVDNFVKKSSIISLSKAAISGVGSECAALAKCEGLEAHKKSVEYRLRNLD